MESWVRGKPLVLTSVSILGQLEFRSISSPAPELVLVTVPAGMKAVLSYLSTSCSSKPQAGHTRGSSYFHVVTVLRSF